MRRMGSGSVKLCRGKWLALSPQTGGAKAKVIGCFEYRHQAVKCLDAWLSVNSSLPDWWQDTHNGEKLSLNLGTRLASEIQRRSRGNKGEWIRQACKERLDREDDHD